MSAELKPSYKQTEVGVIPEDWTVTHLESITDPKRAISYGIVQTGPNLQNGIRCLRVVDIDDGKINTEDMITTSKTISNSYKRTILKADDLVMPLRGKVGDIAIVGEYLAGCNLTRGVALIAVQSDWSARYCRQYISSLSTRNRLEQSMNGSALQEIPISTLRAFKIALPPTKAEQEAIAEALSDADALIESIEQIISKKRQIKQGAMQKLLRPKDGWDNEKLEDIADVIDQHPSHRAPPEVSNGIPFVGIGDLNEDGEIVGTKLRTVAASVFDEHRARYKLEEGLIGLGRVASIGKVVKLKDVGVKFAVSPTLGVIRGTKVRRDYLLYALKSRFVVDQFARIMSGSTRSSVGMIVLRRLDVPLPRQEAEQIAIAAILSDMDAEIAALETKLAKTRSLKQGMMHNLLTGRIRLL